MPVSIDEMISTVETESGGDASGSGRASESKPADEQRFILRYGAAVRAIVRDELERHLRNLAD